MSRSVTPRHRAPASSGHRLGGQRHRIWWRAPVLIPLFAVFFATASATAVTMDQPWSSHATAGHGSYVADPASAGFSDDPGNLRRVQESPATLNGDSLNSAATAHANSSASPSATPSGSSSTSASAAPSTGAAASSSPAAPVATPKATITPQTTIKITTDLPAVPASDASCQTAPTGTACTNAAIAALNHARSSLGLPDYAIPANFATLDVAHQLLTLSNLDRALYGLPAIGGINTDLNAAAQLGITASGDPAGVDVGTVKWTAWASNWASGYPNAIFTYYAWMYDDGLGSANIECTTTNSSGCWGHRLNTLHDFGAGSVVALGVGSGSTAYTELYESFATGSAIAFS